MNFERHNLSEMHKLKSKTPCIDNSLTEKIQNLEKENAEQKLTLEEMQENINYLLNSLSELRILVKDKLNGYP